MKQPTPTQIKNLKNAVRIATKWSYEKQMKFLEKYPKELKHALKLARI